MDRSWKSSSADGKMYLDIKTLTNDGEYLYMDIKNWEKPLVSDGKSVLSGKICEKIDCN